MLSPRWRKVFRDLWVNKTRALLVVLSISIGVFAIGVVVQMQVVVTQDMVRSYAETQPANATLYTAELFALDMLPSWRRVPGVQEVAARRSLMAKFHLAGSDRDDDYPIELFVISDYDDIRINIVRPERIFEPDPPLWPHPDVWPPPKRAALVERSSMLMANLGLVRARQDDFILITMPNGQQREMRLAGVTYDFSRIPATNIGHAYGYITEDTLAWLGEPPGFNELHLRVDETYLTEAGIRTVARQMQDKIEKSRLTVLRTETFTPGKLPLDYQFQALSAILGGMGILSLFLSSFLIVNTISAVLAQHIRQIGIMKVIGAQVHQLAVMYLVMVEFFGVLAVIPAIPLAASVSEFLIGFLSYFINFSLSRVSFSPVAFGVMVAVGLLVPLAAAGYPVLIGVRISAREAISTVGLDVGRWGASWIDRWLGNVRRLPRLLVFALRNTFRQKRRLALTLLTLTSCGAVFISIASARTSALSTLDAMLDYWNYDVQITLARPYRVYALRQSALAVAGVSEVEGWLNMSAFRKRPDGSESSPIFLFALPADTDLLNPRLVQGRWLLPQDDQALVVNAAALKAEPDIALGQSLILQVGDTETTWQVVGIVESAFPIPMAYANYPYLARQLGDTGQASSVQIVTRSHAEQFQADVARAVEAQYEKRAGIRVVGRETAADIRAQVTFFFDLILTMLMSMVVLLAAIGGLGLTGTMSLNLIERTREIAVMRAVGAVDSDLYTLCMSEGIFIGVLSWFLSLFLAFPLGWFLSYETGMRFMNIPFHYSYSVVGALLWLALVVLLSAAATWLPTRTISQLSVREALAYE